MRFIFIGVGAIIGLIIWIVQSQKSKKILKDNVQNVSTRNNFTDNADYKGGSIKDNSIQIIKTKNYSIELPKFLKPDKSFKLKNTLMYSDQAIGMLVVISEHIKDEFEIVCEGLKDRGTINDDCDIFEAFATMGFENDIFDINDRIETEINGNTTHIFTVLKQGTISAVTLKKRCDYYKIAIIEEETQIYDISINVDNEKADTYKDKMDNIIKSFKTL